MKIGDIGSWEAFLGVATHGGFSSAARRLNIPLSQVSRRVAKLESQLGTRLFQRSTRVVSLTDEGKALLPKIHSVLEDLKEAESLFEEKQPLSGTIKITAVPFVAQHLLLPLLGEFMALHPKIRFEIDVSEAFLNIIDAGFDMAMRIETPKDTSLVYRKLAPNDLVFCASPEYLSKNKAPLTSPKDLRSHDLLTLSVHRKCRFKSRDLTLGEFESSKILTCENGAYLKILALGGFGVLVRSIWDVQADLENGSLVQVLTKHPLETFGHIHAVVPGKRFLSPRVRRFLDFTVAKAREWKVAK